MNLQPQQMPQAAQELYSLLAVIADPKAAKVRIDELIQNIAALQEAQAKLDQARVELQTTKKLADELAAETQAKLEDIVVREQAVTVLERNQREQAKELEATHLQQSEEITMRMQQVLARESDVAARNALSDQRVAAIDLREEQVKQREVSVAALQTDLEARQQKLAAIIGS